LKFDMNDNRQTLTATRNRVRVAELTSGVGAVVLGMGIGVIASGVLHGLGLYLLLAGILAHGWGMYAKHRADGLSGDPAPWWHAALYWLCWAVLAGLVLLVLGRVILV
jgi:hypothetical protein